MMNNIQSIKELPEISFIDNLTLEDFVAKLISDYQEKYEEITGQSVSLPPGDVIRLLLGACAGQLYQMYQYIERAGRCNSLKYAYGEFLNHIGALKNVTRHTLSGSKVQMKFILSAARDTDIEIPEGTRVSTGNYDVFWEIQETQVIPAGEVEATFEFECTEPGAASNEYAVGEITELVDPLPYVSQVTNVTKSSGGSDEESDEAYANRILIAPSAYSVAGTKDAYIYFIKSFDSNITDVLVKVDSDATVYIYFLTKEGIPSSAAVSSLQSYMDSADDIKPLTDKVVVAAPEEVSYEISLTYYIDRSKSNQEQTIKAAVENAVDEYIQDQSSEIGKAINSSLLIQKVMNAGAKRVSVAAPLSYTAISETQVATDNPTRTVTYGGLE
jgi:phage-related baseplate assembly protein